MPFRKHHLIPTIILVIVLGANFLSVRPVQADGENPPEPPAPTQVATEPSTEPPAEPPAESTPEPVEATPEPAEATATPLAEILIQAPENTEVVVLDENGDSVPLVSQEAAEIAEVVDPIWCPEGVLPGGAGCSASYTTISDLINNMVSNTAFYSQNGVIYFTADPGTGTFNLSPTTLTGDFDTLKNYNLTLQGGWNGSLASPSLSGQTDFGSRPITIGSNVNPWVGNVTVKDIVFCGNLVTSCSSINQVALTIYTTTGDITLDNVDVINQGNARNTASLNSGSGDITVTDGTYDGNALRSSGFSATTGGSITIGDSSFTDNRIPGAATANGATLSAPIVTLTNVSATGNDGSGIFFAGSILFINGGTFNNNQRYGIELANPAATTIHISSAPTCTGNTLGCTNGVDATPPTLTVPPDITTPATGPAGAVVVYSVSAVDNVDPIVSVTCLPLSGSIFPVGTTIVNCSAVDSAFNIGLGDFQVTVVNTSVVVPPTPPTSTPTVPGSGTSTLGFSYSPSSSTPLIIPVTSGKVIDLDCNSAFWAFGVKLSFLNLCDSQTILSNLDLNDLPGALPDGYSFEMGLDVSILSENQAIEELPNGTGIQMDFLILSGSKDQFVVLYWDGSQWVEVSEQISSEEVSQFVNENGGTELYQVETALDTSYQVLTTNQTGIFVLAKK
jgi:hypothetical protein